MKTELTPEIMRSLGFWQGSYTNVWYKGEWGTMDMNIPGIFVTEECERGRYRDLLGEIVFWCHYLEDLQEEFPDYNFTI